MTRVAGRGAERISLSRTRVALRWGGRVAVAAAMLLGFASPARAEIVYVQSFTGANTSGTSVSVTTNAATTHGDLLVAVVSVNLDVPLTVPTATAESGYNNTWTFITSKSQN